MGLKDWIERPAAHVATRDRSVSNLLRGAAARLTTPLLPDDYLHLANPLWSARELRGRIVEVRRETADSATLVIKPGWGFDFGYAPGQYIGIGLHVDGRWHWRSYSLTSSPTWDRKLISITVKAMTDGFLSSHLVSGVPAGTIVRLAAPKGEFVLSDPPPPKILFLTAGSGITPIMSMLRTLDRRSLQAHAELPDVVHVHSAPTAPEVMFADEIARFGADHEQYRPYVRLTREQGKFTLAELDTVCPDWRERQVWACGPQAMLDDMERFWDAAGLPERLHLERFAVTRADTSGAGGTVTFAKSGKTVTVDGATTLLEAGESAGALMPFGCRMGICQTCVVPLEKGHVVDLRSGKEHAEGERVQTCISAAAGDCTLGA
ncbi:MULTISPECIES: ferredoxin reductase [Rhodococcus]|jgi:ferredoxin-NADP reductase|uniref:ferredoxin reductase n=1 Tax=Rhodococcus TaxID=1827 RepID=UPI000622C753|nr:MULTISPECIES: ferredoxin reductase [Rhodococcus]NCL74382.1 NADPH oxidoreductase [Rhodococcus sp. YH1]AKE90670.1 stearoyl-CoA 9-desaturase [Rhodococcus aetherivorans]ANZ24584.1 stearoyl-CoA 9-desaturase [Rhodococcus sp. WB1]QIX51188.1 ferredoxin reductase [Rhodococcus sp. DMU1]QSE57116.1 ferredoxin reductase [Rhodococcus sp. PSBB066]